MIWQTLRERLTGAASPPEVAGTEPANAWTDPENAPFRLGTGDWDGFRLAGIPIEDLLAEARRWAGQLRGVKRPWLCWNVDPDWCLVQQRQVRDVGWTPVVGFDPRVGPPPLVPSAILVDFNERLRLPTMWLHFPLELLFLFVEERMAYWHADCLIRPEKMRRYADIFAALADGEMAAVDPHEKLSTRLKPNMRRFWEVLGCSTVGASRSQFEHGCGWWLNMRHHPSSPDSERDIRARMHWECGVGIRFWRRRHGGIVRMIPESEIAEGHFTLIGRKDYKRASPVHFKRDLSKELSLNNDLADACRKLGLTHLLTGDVVAEGTV
jgi:hypothetical protein